MFTGIIESIGTIKKIERNGSNIDFTIKSDFSKELKIDQSVSHNGVCLTVIEIENNKHRVTAIKETLEKSNLSKLDVGDKINLERCMKLGERLDGHIVQGHIDCTGICSSIKTEKGSVIFSFSYDSKSITVEKGSITINGVSLTVFNSKKNKFSVAIIPYTLEHTTFKNLAIGNTVNLEFDVIGKYVTRLMNLKN